MKIIFAVLFPFFVFASEKNVESSQDYFSLLRPPEISEADLAEFNIFTNKLERLINSYGEVSSLYESILDNGMNVNDYAIERNIRTDIPGTSSDPADDKMGYLKFPGSTEEHKVALIDKDVHLHQTPNGLKYKIAYKSKAMVLVARSFKNWRFVTDGSSAGWIEAENLREAPKTVYVKQEFRDEKEDKAWMSKALALWREHLEIVSLLEKLKAAKPECPTGLTHEAEDGLVAFSPRSVMSLKYELLVKCGHAKPEEKWPVAKNVQLKKNDCGCLEGDVDGFDKIQMNSKVSKALFKKYKAKESCKVGEHFIVCSLYEGTPGRSLGCPKECVSWF